MGWVTTYLPYVGSNLGLALRKGIGFKSIFAFAGLGMNRLVKSQI